MPLRRSAIGSMPRVGRAEYLHSGIPGKVLLLTVAGAGGPQSPIVLPRFAFQLHEQIRVADVRQVSLDVVVQLCPRGTGTLKAGRLAPKSFRHIRNAALGPATSR